MGIEQNRQAPESYSLAMDSIGLLVKLGYKAMAPHIGKQEDEYVTHLSRKTSDSNSYPCFHIGIVVPFQSPKILIVGFHFDENENLRQITAQGKEEENKEINRLMDNLRKDGKVGVARDQLISALNDQLFLGSTKGSYHSGELAPGKKPSKRIGKMRPNSTPKDRRVRLQQRKDQIRDRELLEEIEIYPIK